MPEHVEGPIGIRYRLPGQLLALDFDQLEGQVVYARVESTGKKAQNGQRAAPNSPYPVPTPNKGGQRNDTKAQNHAA